MNFLNLNGIIIQEQIPNGIEIMVGCAYDEVLGHSIAVGLGGTLVEILEDISFGHVPINLDDIIGMINSLKTKELLIGYRGEQGTNIDNLIETLQRVNLMLTNHTEIQEFDINPLIFDKRRNQFIGVDARIKVRK